MMRRALLTLWLFSFLCFATPLTTTEQHERAKKLHQQGRVAYNKDKDYDEALRLFKEAYDLWPLTDFLVNIGQCHRMMGQYAEALVYFEDALKATTKPKARAKLKEVIAAVKALQAEQAPLLPDSQPTTEPASVPVTLPSSAPVSQPVALPEAPASLAVVPLPLLAFPLQDEPRSRLGVASYLTAGAALAFGSVAGARAFSLGLTLSEEIANAPDEDLRQRQQAWAMMSTTSMGLALLAGGVGYWRLRTEQAPKVLVGVSAVGFATGVSGAVLSFREAAHLQELRAQPDADPFLVRQTEAARAAYARGATVMLSFSLATGAIGYWLLRE